MHPRLLLLTGFFTVTCWAQQTSTVVDANGETIVQVVTLDDLGMPTTQIIATLPPNGEAPVEDPGDIPSEDTTTPPADPIPTPTPDEAPDEGEDHEINGQPGPPPTAAGEPTPFDYTTTIDGVVTVVHDTFTPTFASHPTHSPSFSGRIMPYSEYMASLEGRRANAARGRGLSTRWCHALTLTASLIVWVW